MYFNLLVGCGEEQFLGRDGEGIMQFGGADFEKEGEEYIIFRGWGKWEGGLSRMYQYGGGIG